MPRKQKVARDNQYSFITKEVGKTIMTRAKLRNKFVKTISQELNWLATKKINLSVK